MKYASTISICLMLGLLLSACSSGRASFASLIVAPCPLPFPHVPRSSFSPDREPREGPKRFGRLAPALDPPEGPVEQRFRAVLRVVDPLQS